MDNTQLLIALIIGVLGYSLIKAGLEPWVIEVVCTNMMECE